MKWWAAIALIIIALALITAQNALDKDEVAHETRHP